MSHRDCRFCAQSGFAPAVMWKKSTGAKFSRLMTAISPLPMPNIRQRATEVRNAQQTPVRLGPALNHRLLRDARCEQSPANVSRSFTTRDRELSRPRWNSLQSERITDCKGRRRKEERGMRNLIFPQSAIRNPQLKETIWHSSTAEKVLVPTSRMK